MGAVRTAAPTQSISTPLERYWRRDSRFFTGMAVASAVAVFVGFYPTYYLKVLWGTPVLPPLVHLHGVLFTGWIVLLITQTSLVSVGRTDLHRRLGIGRGVLAGLMMWIATTEILNAPIGRWPVIWKSTAFVAYAVNDFVLGCTRHLRPCDTPPPSPGDDLGRLILDRIAGAANWHWTH